LHRRKRCNSAASLSQSLVLGACEMFGPSVGALQGMKMKRTPEAAGKPAAVKP
jgi:hypothetical protein